MIFVNSMSDLFHDKVELEWLNKIWNVMRRAHKERGHIFQVLTKRPENMLRMLGPRGIGAYTVERRVPQPEPGIWLGVSAEDEKRWDERIPIILDAPTVVPWVSVEPQLGMIDRDTAGLGWAVIGGESGRPRQRARTFEVDWARRMIDRCKESGTPFFMKQVGSVATNRGVALSTRHYAGADPEEWPKDINVREYPDA